MALTAEEAFRLHNRGRDIITKLAEAMDDFNSYARVFEVRGGAMGMGEEYQPDTERIIDLRNQLAVFFADESADQRQKKLDRFRTDY